MPATATPTPTPGPTPDVGIDFSDPFTCGVGFNGTVSGGTPNYTLGYTLRPVTGGTTIDLGTFELGSSGNYNSPADFIDPLSGIDGDFFVSITLTDAQALQVTKPDLFVAEVRSECSTSTPTSGTASLALTYPGPFSNAPGSNQPVAQPTTAPSSSDGGSTPTTPPAADRPPLATTGSDSPLFVTLSILLFTVGGVLVVASRREERSAR